MSKINIQPTETASWYYLIHEAEESANRWLPEMLESYLVFMLMRFMRRQDLTAGVVAKRFLKGLLARGSARHRKLREVGDQCLLISGWFPGLAEKRRLTESYYVDLGRSAYGALGDAGDDQTSELFQLLCQAFLPAVRVLATARNLSNAQTSENNLAALAGAPATRWPESDKDSCPSFSEIILDHPSKISH